MASLSAIQEKVESALQAQATKKVRMAEKRKMDKLIPAKKIGLAR